MRRGCLLPRLMVLALVTAVLAVLNVGAVAASPSGGGTLTSGTYSVLVHEDDSFSNIVYPSTWDLVVNGGSITGVSHWTCCPGSRTDPLTGSTGGGSVTITRDCSGQGQTACDKQVYKGTIGASGEVSGTWESNDNLYGTWTMTLAASVSVRIAAAIPPAGLPVGQTETIAVTVTAGPDALSTVDLSDITSANVKVIAQPPGASDFSLGARASRTFNVQIKGVAAGPADLSSRASATAANGQSVQGSATDDFNLTGPGLAITLATNPPELKLAVNDNGEVVPGKVTVTVTFTNTTKATIDTAQLLLLAPEPVVRSQQLNQLALAKGSLPVLVGPFPASSRASRKFTLTVTGDGKYQWRALAIYNDASKAGGNGRAVGQGGQFTVKVPLLYFKATKDKTEVQAGGSWYVTGRVKNLSSFQTLCLSPLQPQFHYNAGGLGPHQIGVVPVNDPAPPVAGPLAPGQTILFLERVQTEAFAPTASGTLVGLDGSVELTPKATLGVAGDECKVEDIDQRAPVPSSDIKVAPGSNFFQVDVTPAAPSAGGAGALEFFGGYAMSSASLIAQLYESGCSLVKQFSSVDGLVAAFGRGAQGLLDAQAALSRLYHSAVMAASFWIYADTDERDAFEDQVVDAFLQKGGRAWDGVQSTVKSDVESWMSQLQQAYLSGEWSSLFHALGASSANVVNEQAITIASWELAIGAVSRVGAFGKVLQRYETSGLQSEFLNSLKTVPVGRLLNFAEAQRLWGSAYEDYVAFGKIAQDEGVLIGVRGRSPISVENLADGAVWKHEELKPKNVNSIDVKYLGFPSSDMGMVAFRTYTAEQKQEIARQIFSMPQGPLRDAIASRAATRFGEVKYLSKIEQFSQEGQISVGFNYADNGIAQATTPDVRGFDLVAEPVDKVPDLQIAKQGGTYYRPYQENPALDHLADGKGPLPKDASLCIRKLIEAVMKLLCRVTGDMDGVYLTDLQGRALDAEKRIKVYDLLAAVGWQHPETLTWIQNGLFDFTDKTNILKGLQLGGEAMMEFAPGPFGPVVRATYLSLAASKLTSVDDYFVAVLGGLTQFASK